MGKRLLGPDATLSEANTEHLVLYSVDLSPCGRRVMITLLEKGLPFDLVDVDVSNMQQRSPEYLALNPNGFVPTLSHRGQVIFESGAINEYLEEQFPETPLMPATPSERAQVRMWMAAEGAMAKTFRPLMYQRLAGPILHLSRTHDEAIKIAEKATQEPQDLSWESRVWHLRVLTPEEESDHERALLSWLDKVEEALQGRDYLVGDFFSQADISMYPRIAMYRYLGIAIDQARYPNVTEWMARLSRRPSFERSMSAEAKRMRSIATSPVFASVRKTLAVEETDRSLFGRAKLWCIGQLLRRALGVEKLLTSDTILKPLYLPGEVEEGLRPTALQTPQAMKRPAAGELCLYGVEASPYTWRLQSLLDMLGMYYRFESVDQTAGEALPLKLLAFNPQQELPVLVCGEHIINGADTIAEYLLGSFLSDEVWTAGDSQENALSRMWLALEAGNHKELTPLWRRYLCKDESVQFIADEKLALNRLKFPLGILEHTLAQRPYLCAAKPSYADLAWKSRIDALALVPDFQVDAFPALAAWYRRMQDVLTPKHELA
ncbi:MAG: glutathione S-transferase family protein [Pseudomonadota bacterium]